MKKCLFKKSLVSLIAICFIFGVVLVMGRECHAASKAKWESVHANDTDVDAFLYYVKHGNLFVARNRKGTYVRDKLNIIYKNGGCGYIDYGGVLTNGKDILYQDGKNVYLYENAKKKSKAFSLPDICR